MELADLLPLCTRDGCPCNGESRHVEPHQQQLLDSSSKYRYIQGGFGSGKTLIACADHFLLGWSIPGIRQIIGRRTYPKLHDTTQRIFMEVLNRSGVPYEARENREGWHHHIILENGSEFFFRPTQELGRFLGPEYGGWLIDEAQEEPEKTFKDLVGRLRQPLAKGYFIGTLLSNPPKRNHWLHKHFGESPGVVVKEMEGTKSTFQFFKWSTRLNPHVPKEYIADLVTIHGYEEALRVIEGEYGFEGTGTPVYRPPFSHQKHVSEFATLSGIPLIRGWDFGRRHPAVTWHQTYRCRFRQPHWLILAELSDQKEIEVPALAKVVQQYQQVYFPNIPSVLTLDCGDRSGINKSDRGPGPITVLTRAPHFLQFKYRWCDIEPGIDFIADQLAKPVCGCGCPILMVHRRCIAAIEGFAGGYHYRQDKPDRAGDEKPLKDGYYDDVMDSIRYVGENYIRPEWREEGYISHIVMEKNQTSDVVAGRLDWLGGW